MCDTDLLEGVDMKDCVSYVEEIINRQVVVVAVSVQQ